MTTRRQHIATHKPRLICAKSKRTTNKKEEKNIKSTTRIFSLKGGASECGLYREKNEDAVRLGRSSENATFMVVCDGLGGIVGGDEASQFTAKKIAKLLMELPAKVNVLHYISEAIYKVEAEFKRQNIPGRTTLIVAVVHDQFLYYAYIGDGALNVLYPNGQILQLLTPQRPASAPDNFLDSSFGSEIHGEPVLGSLKLSDGCAVFAMTDGASDLTDGIFPAKLIGKFRTEQIPLKQIARDFVMELINAKDDSGIHLHSDNASAAFIVSSSLTMMKNLGAAYEAHHQTE